MWIQIKHWNNFEIISQFHFTCNHGIISLHTGGRRYTGHTSGWAKSSQRWHSFCLRLISLLHCCVVLQKVECCGEEKLLPCYHDVWQTYHCGCNYLNQLYGWVCPLLCMSLMSSHLHWTYQSHVTIHSVSHATMFLSVCHFADDVHILVSLQRRLFVTVKLWVLGIVLRT